MNYARAYITELPNAANPKEHGTVGTSMSYRINSSTLLFQGVGSQTIFRTEACKPERLFRIPYSSLLNLHVPPA